MDDSDDDFKELCASFYQRVKKNGPKEVSGERRTQKASNSSQIRSKLKGTKPTASRSKTLQGPAERKTQSGSRVPRTQKQGAPKQPQSQPAPPENGEGGVCASAEHRDSAWSAQTEAPGSSSQPPPPCLTAMVPSPSKPRAAELVLQRMQQFKRADPERLKHASAGCSLEAAPEEDDPKGPREAVTAGNGSGPGLPATDSDTAVPLILQQEFGQEPAPTRDDSLEDKGLFFCQICQKNLSAMNVTRREQHVNRCLDEAEKALRPSVPQVPECPICGKPFLRLKSRLSHLKQCAARMEVGPQLLLQAVRLQTAQPEGASSTPAPSLGSPLGGLKRKGAATKKEPRKRRKVADPEVPSEDLLVAMALSRSEMEREAVPAALRLGSAFSGKTRPGAEKKSRKKKAPVSPPRLLLQDAEMAGRQLEERVARLLAEEEEAAAERASTPPLPASRLLRELEEGSGRLRPPGRRQNFLWEGSALTGAWALESFYTESLVPSLVPPRPAELAQEPTLPPVLPDPPEPGLRTPPAVHSTHPGGHSPRDPAPSASQREHQALQDLLDLAGEGLSASPQPCSGGPAGTGGEAGMDLSPGGLPLTGFVLPAKEKHAERGGQASLSLGLLVADFGAMVNNPHLSDVQFQTDSGEVLYAHKFVLYARCPLLMQHVNSEGFFASEDGDVRAQRVLLSDVSTEATCVFLHYLYTADAALPPRLAPDLSSLAHRFGVSELVHLCEQVPVGPDSGGEQRKEQENEDCESRGETFRELLRSVWRGEEGAEALSKSEGREEDDREEVNEEEMEEIYEFAATQRMRLQAGGAPEVEEEAEQLQEDAPASVGILGSTEDKEESENAEQMASSGQGRDEAPAPRKNVREATRLPLGDLAAGREERVEAPEEGLGHSRCPGPAQGQADRGDSTPLCSVDAAAAAAAAEQPSSSPHADGPEPSWRTSNRQEGDGSVWERGVDSSHPPAHQQAPPLCSHFVPSQPPRGRSPRRPHPPHTSALCPPAPQLPGTPPRAPSSSSPPKTRGVRSLPPPPEDPGREDEGCESALEHRGKEVLLSPEKSPCADPTQAKPGCSSAKSHDSLSSVNREDEIILLLDSDEELELEQTRRMPVLKGPPEGRKVLEVSTKSSELFPIIDVDEDQEASQSPPGREATLQWEVEGLLGNRGSVGGRRTPQLFGDPQRSSDEDSTMDSSWLVPATPLASKSRDCSSQTRITGLRSRPPADPTARPKPSARAENRHDLEATPKFSVIVPQTSSSRLGPVAPGSPGSRRQVCRSLSSPHPQHHQPFSPLAPCPLAGGLADVTGRFQRSLPPVPSPAGQASASEVVEVEDSDDEQEVASRQVNSSPLLERDPPMPADDWCWHVEPLSPIPIDHLNLERTGPLSTSSPSSWAGGAPDSRGCHSPAAPMATPPLHTGSCTGRRKSHEKSPGAGSPGGSRLSFLNSALWDDWDGEEQKSPQGLPLAQPPPSKLWELQTPKGANQKNLPLKVPITPLPRYSLMETPELRKELDRFGVRPLPKRQMVLKLKEIFQYTHQTLPSDSEDEGQSSRVPLEAPCSQTLTTRTSKASGVAGNTPLEATSGPIPQRSKGPAKTRGLQHPKQQPGGSVPGLSMSPAKEGPLGPDSDAQLPASQESTASSVDSSDSSCRSQSSSCESGAALESAGDEESEEGVSASQAADQAAATEEAVRRCIRSRPALYRKVLLYQPFELAELQAELKQQGIRVATGKLLDFLDAHCITFTTAAARKEKLGRKRRQPLGKKRGSKAGQPGPSSTPPAVSSPQGSAPPQ